MPNTLKLEIATTEKWHAWDDVELVTVPGIEGQIGIYPGHMPLMTVLQSGTLTFEQSGTRHLFAIGEGMVEVTGDLVVVLSDMAIPAEEVDERRAQEKLERDQEKLKMELSAREYAAVSGEVNCPSGKPA